jgi:hypothetical protein
MASTDAAAVLRSEEARLYAALRPDIRVVAFEPAAVNDFFLRPTAS